MAKLTNRLGMLAAVAAGIAGFGSLAQADTLTFNWSGNGNIFDPSTPAPTPGSGGPTAAYFTAVFSDTSTTNRVQLTLTANLASDPSKSDNFEDVSDVYFNLQPDAFVSHLNVFSSLPAGVTLVQQSPNTVNAGNVHTFDLQFDTGSGKNSLLTGSQSVTLLLDLGGYTPTTGQGSLTSQSFNYTTPGVLPNPAYFAAIHVQGTGSNWQGSTFVGSGTPTQTFDASTPLPKTAWGGIVLLGGLAVRRKMSGAMKLC